MDIARREDEEEVADLGPEDTGTTIAGLRAEEWERFRARFLFLTPPEDEVRSELGTVSRGGSFRRRRYM